MYCILASFTAVRPPLYLVPIFSGGDFVSALMREKKPLQQSGGIIMGVMSPAETSSYSLQFSAAADSMELNPV